MDYLPKFVDFRMLFKNYIFIIGRIMAVIRPFKALRPTKEKAQLVASVPYDVVNREEAKHFAEGNPLSYLHITRSEIDLPEVKDVYSKEVYLKAKENLNRIIKEAPLKLDEKPALLSLQIDNGWKSTNWNLCNFFC